MNATKDKPTIEQHVSWDPRPIMQQSAIELTAEIEDPHHSSEREYIVQQTQRSHRLVNKEDVPIVSNVSLIVVYD